MTPRHITFGSIERFETFMKDFKYTVSYQEQDDNNEPIYDKYCVMPKLTLTMSEKIHGSNGSVCYGDNTFWVQSRENIITPEKDNAGCAFFAETQKDSWISIINELAYEYNIDLSKNVITVFYEWCGGNIQKNSCVSSLDKLAIIFQYFKVSPILTDETDEKKSSIWLKTKTRIHKKPDCEFHWVDTTEKRIFNVMNLPYYTQTFDFEKANESYNEIVKLVEGIIEPDSPIGRFFGIEKNVGEGVVATFEYKNCVFRFKVKGDKHSNSKVKKLVLKDDEKENKKIECANKITLAWRLEQAMQKVFGINNETKEPTIKDTSDFIKTVMNDIVKEELNTIAEFGLELKEVVGYVSKICSTYFKEQLTKF